jgi:3-hydroxy-9,10-secoandrosta-1,3,5(10)-triene-9,17-dione monooxygenase reductase component
LTARFNAGQIAITMNKESGPVPGDAADQQATMDSRALRNALGSFATGVVIVTTRNTDGQDVGVTANSFNSVSLNPPMVLWSLSRTAMSLPSFQQSPCFAVHVLAADQDDLSRRFATKGASKFQDLAVKRGAGNVPLIDGCAARFQCRTAFSYDAGDHIIFVGEVLAFDASQRSPLLFHAGRYALVEQMAPAAAANPAVERAGGPDHEFLFGLLGRAHNHMYQGIQTELGLDTLSAEHLSVLGLLGRSKPGGEADATGDIQAGNEAAAASRLVDAVRSMERLSGCNLQTAEIQLLKQLLRKLLGEGRGSP